MRIIRTKHNEDEYNGNTDVNEKTAINANIEAENNVITDDNVKITVNGKDNDTDTVNEYKGNVKITVNGNVDDTTVVNGAVSEDEDSGLYDDDAADEEATGLHGYEKTSPGCGNKIQLENPDKKELLVWFVIDLGGGSGGGETGL